MNRHARRAEAQQALQAKPPLAAVPPPQADPITKGARFTRWRVVRTGGVLRSGHRYVPCECVCGIQALVYDRHLLQGRSTGCVKRACRNAWEAGQP